MNQYEYDTQDDMTNEYKCVWCDYHSFNGYEFQVAGYTNHEPEFVCHECVDEGDHSICEEDGSNEDEDDE